MMTGARRTPLSDPFGAEAPKMVGQASDADTLKDGDNRSLG
jgi:hypothetical protein